MTLHEMVVSLERKLGISVQWMSSSAEWKSTQILLNMRAYQRALDNLEALIVACLFEMAKMNMSRTGTTNVSLTTHTSFLKNH
jgi:hypothetical protein